MHDQAASPHERLQDYGIRGGREGRDRLRVLGRGLAPTTSRLLDRVGRIDGARVTTVAIADGLVAGGLATRDEVDRLIAELESVTGRDDTAISCPRIFQAHGRKPG